MQINLIKNTFFNESLTKKRLCKFIEKSKRLSLSEEVERAEKNFAEYIHRKYCVLFNSGSSANLAIVQAYLNLGKIKKGDKVGISALTWSTNIMPLIQLGLIPVPVDIQISTLNVSSEILEKTIKLKKIKAFFATNVLGFCSDLEKIKEICKKYNVLFFEDNCESLGSRYKGKLLGNFGDSATYSFYVGHHLSTIEGGAVVTDDKDLHEMLLMVRAHGWDRNMNNKSQVDIRKKYKITDNFYDKYTFYDLGFNLRPTEITGFLLNENLKYADKIVLRREKIFKEIYEHIVKTTGEDIYPLSYDHMDLVSNFAIPVVCKDKKTFKNLLDSFSKAGVELRPLISGNLVHQPFFQKYVAKKYLETDLPNSDIVHHLGFYFGNNPDLTTEEIDYIKKIFG